LVLLLALVASFSVLSTTAPTAQAQVQSRAYFVSTHWLGRCRGEGYYRYYFAPDGRWALNGRYRPGDTWRVENGQLVVVVKGTYATERYSLAKFRGKVLHGASTFKNGTPCSLGYVGRGPLSQYVRPQPRFKNRAYFVGSRWVGRCRNEGFYRYSFNADGRWALNNRYRPGDTWRIENDTLVVIVKGTYATERYPLKKYNGRVLHGYSTFKGGTQCSLILVQPGSGAGAGGGGGSQLGGAQDPRAKRFAGTHWLGRCRGEGYYRYYFAPDGRWALNHRFRPGDTWRVQGGQLVIKVKGTYATERYPLARFRGKVLHGRSTFKGGTPCSIGYVGRGPVGRRWPHQPQFNSRDHFVNTHWLGRCRNEGFYRYFFNPDGRWALNGRYRPGDTWRVEKGQLVVVVKGTYATERYPLRNYNGLVLNGNSTFKGGTPCSLIFRRRGQ
jgi:hypothetical protein